MKDTEMRKAYKAMRTDIVSVIIIILCLIVLAIFSFVPINKVINTQTFIGVVKDKHISPENGEYIIVVENIDLDLITLEISNSFLKKRFDADTTFEQLTIGKTYTFTTNGIEVSLFDIYPNVSLYKEVT